MRLFAILFLLIIWILFLKKSAIIAKLIFTLIIIGIISFHNIGMITYYLDIKSRKNATEQAKEDTTKQLLQGMWFHEDTEKIVIFCVKDNFCFMHISYNKNTVKKESLLSTAIYKQNGNKIEINHEIYYPFKLHKDGKKLYLSMDGIQYTLFIKSNVFSHE